MPKRKHRIAPDVAVILILFTATVSVFALFVAIAVTTR
jgi:hypothetical protein